MDDHFTRLAVALGIGLLIGLERGWRGRDEAPGHRTAGIRTFALTGLLGGVVGLLAQALPHGGGLLLGLGFAAYAGVFAWFCAAENRADGTFSATTVVAGLTTFALGAAAILADLRLAAAAAVATAGLLALREGLHGWVARLTYLELRAGLLLTAMTFIALPLLPDRPIGPFGGVNPTEIWLIAIVLAAVSFLGYAAVKAFGTARGVFLAAAAGGLVSSTAVMATNARRAAAGEGAPRLLAAAAILATSISLLRALAVVAALNAAILAYVALPLIAAAVMATLAAVLLARHATRGDEQAVAFRNPFELVPVIGFAVLLGFVVIAARVLTEQFGEAGAIVGALVGGLGDIDAVIVSVAKLAPASLSTEAAARAVLAAVGANTFAKLFIGAAIARGAFAVAIAAAMGAAVVAAGVAMAMAWPLAI